MVAIDFTARRHGYYNSLLALFDNGVEEGFTKLGARHTIFFAPTAKELLIKMEIHVAVGASGYEAVGLYKGSRLIASKGEASTNWQLNQLVLYCFYDILAGILGGLLGLGVGFILGPLFLELGIPPQMPKACFPWDDLSLMISLSHFCVLLFVPPFIDLKFHSSIWAEF